MTNGIQVSLEELIMIRFQVVGAKLSSHKKVKTTMVGSYPSFFHGRGMDFMELRHYQPGDDIRAIDWRVSARTRKTHIKLFREERERPVFLLVDYGPQMFFGTQVRFKSVAAAYAAAWLAWTAKAHGDRVGGLILPSVEKHEKLRPVNGQRGVSRLLNALVDRQPTQAGEIQMGQLSWALAQLQQAVQPGSLVCLISDFHGLDADGEIYIKRLAQHNDVLAVFIYDSLEKALPSQPGNYDMTNGQQMLSFTHSCQVYQERFEQRYTYLDRFFKQQGARCLPLATHDEIPEVLRDSVANKISACHFDARKP
jgi:uncharacterized protein (DUF58 family)